MAELFYLGNSLTLQPNLQAEIPSWPQVWQKQWSLGLLPPLIPGYSNRDKSTSTSSNPANYDLCLHFILPLASAIQSLVEVYFQPLVFKVRLEVLISRSVGRSVCRSPKNYEKKLQNFTKHHKTSKYKYE